jgi:hypothetical protein
MLNSGIVRAAVHHDLAGRVAQCAGEVRHPRRVDVAGERLPRARVEAVDVGELLLEIARELAVAAADVDRHAEAGDMRQRQLEGLPAHVLGVRRPLSLEPEAVALEVFERDGVRRQVGGLDREHQPQKLDRNCSYHSEMVMFIGQPSGSRPFSSSQFS